MECSRRILGGSGLTVVLFLEIFAIEKWRLGPETENENENENETESEKGRRMGCFLCLITMMMDEMRNMGVYIMITFV